MKFVNPEITNSFQFSGTPELLKSWVGGKWVKVRGNFTTHHEIFDDIEYHLKLKEWSHRRIMARIPAEIEEIVVEYRGIVKMKHAQGEFKFDRDGNLVVRNLWL